MTCWVKDLGKAKNILISLGLRLSKRMMKGPTGGRVKSCLNLVAGSVPEKMNTKKGGKSASSKNDIIIKPIILGNVHKNQLTNIKAIIKIKYCEKNDEEKTIFKIKHSHSQYFQLV